MAEANGIPIGLAIAGTNWHDSKMVEAILENIPVVRPKPTAKNPQSMCMDKAYDSGEIRALVKQFSYTAHIRSLGEEAQAIKRQMGVKACRWVAERKHSWMNRFRHILNNSIVRKASYFLKRR